jgi:serine-type D-Ala-D-Ala carboxypeptidase (penicillin-binding protein 5/6)
VAGACVALLAFGARPAGALPALSAPAATVIEADNDTPIYSLRADERRSIASTTKLMTAYVALQHASPGRVLTVQPYTPAPEETVAGLVPGQRLTVADLLRAMLLPSGGDAAHTLAVDLGGSAERFLSWMNSAARRLRMRGTHYSTPVGLDTYGNYSTARDLAQLALTLMRNSTFAHIVAQSSARLTDGQVVPNRNDLVGRYPYVIGIKTGHTSAAGYCLVGAGRSDGVTVISVVLGDPSEATRDADTLALLRYGLASYHRVEPVRSGRVYARIRVLAGAGQPADGSRRVRLLAKHSVSLILRHGAHLEVYLTGVPASVPSPLAPHTPLGDVVVRVNGRIVKRVPLRLA